MSDGYIRICPFNYEDYEEVYALWEEVFPDANNAEYSREVVKRFLERNPGTSFVARTDNKIIGAVLAGYDGWRGYIYHLGIRKDYRRKGVGDALLTRAEGALAGAGIEKVHLFVLKDNAPAKAFYGKHRYQMRDTLDIHSKYLK